MLVRRRLIAILIAFAIVVSAFISCGFVLFNNTKQDSSDSFRRELAALYQEYDSGLSEDAASEEFGLRRLIVSDYNGKNYNAEKAVVDYNNSFALLQYNSADDAKKAYQQIQEDGLIVDADSLATLDSADKGQMYPQGSDTLGTPAYISNFEMDYEDVIVAVVDTGVMYDHPDIKNRFYSRGYDYSADNNDDAYYDTKCVGDYYAHATFVSGVIADNTPDNVKILPYKSVAFGATSATASAIISSINDAVARGADVISISLTSGSSRSAFNTAVKNAVDKGVCICASAGNEGKEVANRYPSCCPGAITVSALNKNNVIANYSNFGAEVDFCAPGSGIVSTVPQKDGTGGYATNSGTSFSTPYVSAICADIKSVNQALTRDDVYGVIKDFAVDYGDEGYDVYYGYGVPNISNMVYTDSESYSYSIPQGVLDVFESKNYTADTQPWSLFASKIKTVNIDDSVEKIGSYSFYNMNIASFNMADTYTDIGDYAFYGCRELSSFNFGLNVNSIGIGAFGDMNNDFVIRGYQNTIAQSYAKSENIEFEALGCKHNYIMTIFDPTEDEEGYTQYACRVCGDTYIGEYIEPVLIQSGACGENLSFSLYDTGRLLISGTGDMYDYSLSVAPWYDNREFIKYVVLTKEVLSVSPFAFWNCNNIYEFRCNGDHFVFEDDALYNGDKTALIYYLSNSSSTVFDMPASLKEFDASAFINAPAALSVHINNNFELKNSVIYNTDGDIVMALPSLPEKSITIDSNITIKKYAFLICPSVTDFYAESSDIVFDAYSIGYGYNGALEKNSLVFHGVDDTSASVYANSNGFEYSSYNSGKCGANISWSYDLRNNILNISGSGAMYNYSDVQSVPWSKYIPSIRKVYIDDGIVSLSRYSFYGASQLNELTMPLSITAPEDETTWYSCTNIKTITLTLGTGYTDDYGDEETQEMLYKFTPWYLSRNSITSFSLDENVKYIGDYAFRNCLAIKQLTLNCCEKIGKYAFLACSKLTSVTNYCKTTQISDYALFSYNYMYAYHIYTSSVLSGYDDSTSKDYCDRLGAKYESLGCGHSRDCTALRTEPTCCTDGIIEYYCNDCNTLAYEEYIYAQTKGHFVKGTVSNIKNVPVGSVDIYIDSQCVAITNSDGLFITDKVLCGEHIVNLKKHDKIFATGKLIVDHSNAMADISIRYGDFHTDGVVNAKDYAYAAMNGYDDRDLFNMGRIVDNNYFEISQSYDEQSVPTVVSFYNASQTNSNYQRRFIATIENNSEYVIKECGFIYGKNMTKDMLVLENVGSANPDGYTVKKEPCPQSNNLIKMFSYGASSRTGTVCARFYIIYTNGVIDNTYYSDMSYYKY